MKFKEICELLLELTFNYKVPKEKKLLLYDFYLMELIDNSKARPGSNWILRPDPNLKSSVSAAKEDLLKKLKKELLDALLFAVSAEFRHILDDNINITSKQLRDYFKKKGKLKFLESYVKNWSLINSTYEKFLTDEPDDFVTKERRLYMRSNPARLRAFKVLKKTKIKPEDFMKLAEGVFRDLSWDSSYGGKPWAGIAKGWGRLNKAEGQDRYIWIDHVYDLQHNTNTVFNKLASYYDTTSGYDWIKTALDYKANTKDEWDLYNKVSPSMKRLAAATLFNKGFGSAEEFLKKNSIPSPDKRGVGKPIKTKLAGSPELFPVAKFEVGDKVKIVSKIVKVARWNKDKTATIINVELDPLTPFEGHIIFYKVEWSDGLVIGKIFEHELVKASDTEKDVWDGGIWKGGYWEDGTWENGTWKKGTWKDGLWENGVWESGIWEAGTWEKGTWKDGRWETGIWETGLWKSGVWVNGEWNNGTWEKGIWVGGIWYDGDWYDGKWEFGTWTDGLWMNGTWESGIWEAGGWKDGLWKGGTWKGGRWKSGYWKDGDWENGIWEDGRWEKGYWKKGTWKGGVWWNGIWDGGVWQKGIWKTGLIYDPDKKGNFEEDWKWESPYYVRSPINPKEYFAK